MGTVRKATNSVMWIALGVMLLMVDIVTAIDPQVTNWVAFNRPDSVENGIAHWPDGMADMGTTYEWYEVAKIDNIMGVVFIIGGLIGIGAILYEKHSKNHI